MNMLEQLYVEVRGVKSEIKDVKSEIKDLKDGQARTEERLIRIESKTDSIENKLDNMEAQNANRHIEINGKLDDLSTDLTVVEAVTGKNMADIANIKLVK